MENTWRCANVFMQWNIWILIWIGLNPTFLQMRTKKNNWSMKTSTAEPKTTTKLFIKSLKHMLSTTINFRIIMVTDYELWIHRYVIFIQKVWNYNEYESSRPKDWNEQTYCCMTQMQILPFFSSFFHFNYFIIYNNGKLAWYRIDWIMNSKNNRTFLQVSRSSETIPTLMPLLLYFVSFFQFHLKR